MADTDAAEAGAGAWFRAGGPDGGLCPRAQFERRGGLKPLPASVLCRERGCARGPDRRLGQAAALAALVPPDASAALRLRRFAWAPRPFGFCVAVATGGAWAWIAR
ncbi:hypothetical protein NDU88_004665 [Pleurodeles waltl]|uniref:Uncharacterized protein n=1 Tax=Pleurodeles waltl TaxID=8319 RepID=A0AAV7UFU9_PLEWA|nr:hypothetical protein NDU88_004665 [Pleurodeles waltl]